LGQNYSTDIGKECGSIPLWQIYPNRQDIGVVKDAIANKESLVYTSNHPGFFQEQAAGIKDALAANNSLVHNGGNQGC
jgi:hypothetical protein